jgi:hypothetical protein
MSVHLLCAVQIERRPLTFDTPKVITEQIRHNCCAARILTWCDAVSPVIYHRRFGGRYCLHLQSRKISQISTALLNSGDCLFGLFFDPEDGDNIFLSNHVVNLYRTIRRHITEAVLSMFLGAVFPFWRDGSCYEGWMREKLWSQLSGRANQFKTKSVSLCKASNFMQSRVSAVCFCMNAATLSLPLMCTTISSHLRSLCVTILQTIYSWHVTQCSLVDISRRSYHSYWFTQGFCLPCPCTQINSSTLCSRVGIAQSVRRRVTWLDGQVSIPGKGKTFFCSPYHPHRLWGPHSLLSNGYWGIFSLG